MWDDDDEKEENDDGSYWEVSDDGGCFLIAICHYVWWMAKKGRIPKSFRRLKETTSTSTSSRKINVKEKDEGFDIKKRKGCLNCNIFRIPIINK